jgi:hypothetical protein
MTADINLRLGNPAVLPARQDPWLCAPLSRTVCLFDLKALLMIYEVFPSIIKFSFCQHGHKKIIPEGIMLPFSNLSAGFAPALILGHH